MLIYNKLTITAARIRAGDSSASLGMTRGNARNDRGGVKKDKRQGEE